MLDNSKNEQYSAGVLDNRRVVYSDGNERQITAQIRLRVDLTPAGRRNARELVI